VTIARDERTLVLIKPDALSRGLAGAIMNRYLQRSLKIVALEMLVPAVDQIEAHYAEHADKPDRMIRLTGFMAGRPLIAMVLQGPDAIAIVHKLNGKTSALEAEPGTIRGDYADNLAPQRTLVHGSDGVDAAEREIALWFPRFALTNDPSYEPNINQRFGFRRDQLVTGDGASAILGAILGFTAEGVVVGWRSAVSTEQPEDLHPA
jgi:nucleoside-diphosphate kinase